MVVKIKKVILKFIGTGINDIMQACVNIYHNNDLICSKETYNGQLEMLLEENKVYRIFARTSKDIINGAFYVNTNYKYVFIFNSSIYRNNIRTITFLLTDANYNNLPIQEGEMFIWQNQ